MLIHYIIGALAGGGFGYFVLYRLIGCATGTCPITSNPYISIIYGIYDFGGIIDWPYEKVTAD